MKVCGSDNLSALASRLECELRHRGIAGRHAARPQQEIARWLGTTTRAIQAATLVLNERGVPIVSSCEPPHGVFLAVTVDEIDAYRRQLSARITGNALRLKFLTRIRNAQIARRDVEPTGQRRLFA